MKKCLNCEKDYEPKRDTSKFCSTSCRVRHHQKHGKSKIKPVQMQELYNSVLSAINSINVKNSQPSAFAAVVVPEPQKEAEISFNEAQDGLMAATSSHEIEVVWRRIIKKSNWAGWQMKRLEQLKDNQSTKLDF